MALIDLKKIGSYVIGSGIGTSLNYFGESPGRFYLERFNLVVKKVIDIGIMIVNIIIGAFQKRDLMIILNIKKNC